MPGPFPGSNLPPNEGWFAKQIAGLQRQIDELRAARTLESATIANGGIFVTDGSNAAHDAAVASHPVGPGQVGAVLVADAGGVIWSTDHDLSVPRAWTDVQTGEDFTGSWQSFWGSSVDIPHGMTRMWFVAIASAGETLSSGSGSISVQSKLEWSTGTVVAGDAINSGTNTVPVANAMTSNGYEIPAGATSVRFGVAVADAIGSSTRLAASGNWHQSAFVLFTRG